MCVVQAILGFVRLAYDDCVLRSAQSGRVFNGNKMFGMFAGVLQHVSALLFHQGSVAFSGLHLPAKRKFRDLSELLDAGYKLKSKVGDLFSAAEAKLIEDALALSVCTMKLAFSAA